MRQDSPSGDDSITMTPNEALLMLRAGLSRLDNEVTVFIQSQGIDPAPAGKGVGGRFYR
jgi:hypothetical protein